MALYRCKFSIRDPLLLVLEAVDKTESVNHPLTTQRKDLNGYISVVGLKENEEIFLVNTDFLPVEHVFTDLTGLEPRKIQAATPTRELESVVELLAGKRKLIFFEQDSEEIHYE